MSMACKIQQVCLVVTLFYRELLQERVRYVRNSILSLINVPVKPSTCRDTRFYNGQLQWSLRYMESEGEYRKLSSLTSVRSSERASCCEPRQRNGRIRVGPTLLTGIAGWLMDVRGGHLNPSLDVDVSDLESQRDACCAWKSIIPPVEEIHTVETLR